MIRLDDIVGQPRAVESLRRAVDADKLAHGYLFGGPEGVGKRATADALAAGLQCVRNTIEACGECDSCAKVEARVHADVLVLEPDGNSIKIEQVRAMEQQLPYAPHEGAYRVILVDGADKLTLGAANAMLKSLEEPRPRTVFILIASAAHQVTPTLVSRCQRLRFAPLSREDVDTVIAGCAPEAEAGARQAAVAVAEGSPGRALKLLNSEQLEGARETATALRKASRGGSVAAVFEAAAAAGRDRAQLLDALDLLRAWMRDLLLVVEGLEDRGIIHSDQLEALAAEAQRLGRAGVIRQLREVEDARASIVAYVNPAMTLEHLGLRLRRDVHGAWR